jgi:hypothetical protein
MAFAGLHDFIIHICSDLEQRLTSVEVVLYDEVIITTPILDTEVSSLVVMD